MLGQEVALNSPTKLDLHYGNLGSRFTEALAG